MSRLTKNERYWLGQGPITQAETNKAFKYLRKHGKPTDLHERKHYIAKLRKRNEINRYLRGKEEANADPTNPWQIVYGPAQVGGTVTFMHTSGPAEQPNLYLHTVITLAAHEITYLEGVYFDGYVLSWDATLTTRPTGVVNATGIFAGLVKMQINYGSDGQSALSELVADVPTKWTSDHRQRGHAHVYLRLRWNDVIFKNGVPDITFRLTGKYSITDPRTGLNSPGAHTAAVVLYDYMTNSRFGLGLSSSDFNSSRINQAITDCEDAIPLAAGGVENRYLTSFHVGVDDAPGALIEDILSSMAARLVYSEGKYSVYAGKGRSPVMTITQDMILSDIQVFTKTPRQDSFNSVRGTFISAPNDFEEADFPAVTNSTYVTADSGVTIYEDLSYGMIISPARCQRLAKIELERNRQGIVAEFTARMDAYQAEPGEWVNVTFPEFGWSSKTFEVLRSALQIEDSPDGSPVFTVRLLLKETASAVYDWNSGMETTHDVNPNTNLPNPFAKPAAPTGLTLASGTAHLYLRSDGTVFSRLFVSWTAAADAFVQNGGYYEIQARNTDVTTEWTDQGDVPGSSTSYYILDVQDDSLYDVRIRSVSALGQRGDWVTASAAVTGKSQPPSNVTGVVATVERFRVRVSWAAVSDLDVREYEVRYGPISPTWDELASTAVRVRATSHTFTALSSGTVRFRVRAIDTSGNYSVADAFADLAVSAPGAPQNLAFSMIDNNVMLRWEPPLTTTFTLSHYRVSRQSGSVVEYLGTVSGTFFTYVELVSGLYTFRVSAVDVAGNEGASAEVTTVVYPPPDFVLRADQDVPLAGATLSSAVYIPETFSVQAAANSAETWLQHFTANGYATIQEFIDIGGYSFWLEPLTDSSGSATFTTTTGSVWAPFETAQTWTTHFTNSGYDQIQDFIDAGWNHWLLPNGLPAATISVEVDLGEVLPQAAVRFDFVAFGSPIYVPTVSWKEDSGDPWVSGPPGVKTATPSNYRYLRLSFAVTPVLPNDWCVISAVRLTVFVKEITDSGVATCDAGDSGGTTIAFNKDFLDVSSIVVTPQGTTGLYPVVDFNDVANPSSFKVLLFDAAGSRASADVRWTARGVQAVL